MNNEPNDHRRARREQDRTTGLMFILVAFFLAAVVLPEKCSADTIVGAHVGTWHDKTGFNNVNPGMYAVRDGWAAGVYRNSERGTSAYAAHVFETGDRRFALTVGAVAGYKRHPVMPLVVPSMRIGSDSLAARLTLVPAAEKGGTTALHLSVEMGL